MDSQKVLAALRDFFEQVPGFETANYSTYADYRKDYRQALKDLHKCRELYNAVRFFDFTAEEIAEACRTFSGRLQWLSWTDDDERWDYTPGQYWPMEYRAAASAVLAELFKIIVKRCQNANV